MKSILLFILLGSSLSFAAQTICRHENIETAKQTMFVLENRTLMAICQRSNTPSIKTISNQEICANDMYLLQSSSSGSITADNFASTTTNVVFNISPRSSGSKSVSLSSPYNALTFSGGNKVSLPAGTMKLNCK